MGGAFWVGYGWFFFGALVGGDGGGEEKTPGHVHQGRFAGRRAFLNSPIMYVICYILISGGFTSSVRIWEFVTRFTKFTWIFFSFL